jgi:hypothetical protein
MLHEGRNSRVWRNGDDAKQWHLPNSLLDCVHLLVSGLLRKPFAPSGLLLFREQRVPARAEDRHKAPTCRAPSADSVSPRKEWQGFLRFVSVVLGHDVDHQSDVSQMRTAAANGRDAVRRSSSSGGRLKGRGSSQATMSRTHLPDALDALCNFTVVAW